MWLCASVSAQPLTPRPHPTPTPATRKIDKTPPALMPADTVWGLALNNPLTVPPAYDGTHAFFSLDGDRLAAYNLITGTREWMITARPQMEPVAGEGLLFIIEPDALTALHIADGSVAWQIPFSEKLVVHPVWDNGWLIVASDRGEIGALRASDGQLIWRRDIKSPAHAAPALAADRVYIPTTDSRIVALRVESGEPVWERRLGGAPNEVLALNDRLYAGSQDNFFYCVMAADGRVDWRWRTGGDVIGTPIADERHVYFVALDNVLRALNQVSGGQQWMRPLPMRPAWGPVRAGSTIVVAGQAATLRAFNLKDGVAVGTLTGVAPAPPVVPTADAPPDALAPADAPPKEAPPALLTLTGVAPAPPPEVPSAGAPADAPAPAEAPPKKAPPALLTLTGVVPAPPPEVPPAGASADAPAPADAPPKKTLPKKAPPVFDTLAADAEVAAAPHVLEHPATRLPMVLLLFKEIAKGASATLVARSIEPTLDRVAALPNLIQIAPTTPVTPPKN